MSGLVSAIFGGGDSAPAAPDYAAAAKATAQGNKEAAQFAVNANRINQFTPYGSLTYSKAPRAFDQAGYDAAMAKYNAEPVSTGRSPGTRFFNDELGVWDSIPDSTPGAGFGVGSRGPAPTREQFMGPDDGGGWSQTMTLTPQAQATLDKQMRLSDQYADTASKGFANVQGLLENPNIDTSGMPQMRGIDMSQMTDVRRLNPMMSGGGQQRGGRSLAELMGEQTQVLEQIPEYRQSMEIQRSLQGRQPTPEQLAQLTALSERISSNPALNQFQERARQQQMPSGPDQDGIRSLNSDMSGIRGLNAEGLNQVGGINFNALPQAPINSGQTAQDAIFSRLNPTLQRDEEALRQRLANQGIALGSEAYNREMSLAGQRATDMRLQAAAQGIGLDQAARQQSFGEQLSSGNFDLTRNNQQFGQRQAMTAADMLRNQQQFGQNQAITNSDLVRNQQAFGQNQASSLFDLNLRNQQFNEQQNLAALSGQQRNQALQEAYTRQSRPLDLVNALRTGAQVQNPQFQNFAQQATTQGANMLGAANAQYGAEMNAFNAQNAQNSGLLGGIAGIGLGLAGLPGAGGSISKGFSGLFA